MKKIAFISPVFFDIDKNIEEELITRGFKVLRFDERIDNKKTTKILLRMQSPLIKRKLDKYYRKVLREIIYQNIKLVLIIKAESVPVWFLEILNKNHVRIIHYICDPINNYPTIKDKLKYFDKCYTFDGNDAKNYGMIHRPLFYSNDVIKMRKRNLEVKYSVSFIGTLHSDRDEILSRIINAMPDKYQENSFVYYYIPMKIMWIYQRLFRKRFKKVSYSDLNTTPLEIEENLKIMGQSKIVIDIHHDSQTGLTNRTLEVLGLNRKLITTNEHIKNYDFYNSSNILVVDKINPTIDRKWLETNINNDDDESIKEYTLDKFVDDLLEV